MTTTKLDLTGLKCPLPALKTRKALKPLKPGDRLEVHCTDPLSVIDIPNLIRETGDKVEITERAEQRIVFLIEKRVNCRRLAGLVPENDTKPTLWGCMANPGDATICLSTSPAAFCSIDLLRRGAEAESCSRAHAHRVGISRVRTAQWCPGITGKCRC